MCNKSLPSLTTMMYIGRKKLGKYDRRHYVQWEM